MLILRSPSLTLPGIGHGFFGRTGGVSEGIYASLNCGPGSNDAPAAVAENRRRACVQLGGPELASLYQIHSAEAVTVNAVWPTDQRPKADAMVTDKPGIALGILTADCAPVLLADAEAHVIGAAHAGWNGAFSGVTDTVVAAMERLGAKRARIAAVVGPCISQPAYEVGPEFEARFLSHDAANTRFFAPSTRDGHWQFDLPNYVAHRLSQAGVGSVDVVAACTYARESDFFSYRRTTHRKEPDYGRQLSAIALS